MTVPLAPAEARALLRDAFTPRDAGCWGLEVEWVVHPRDDPTARPGLRQLDGLAGLVLPAGGRVTLEPGGQLELSTAPRRTLDDALDALAADTGALESLLAGRGLVAVDVAVDLQRLPLRILDLPRYRAMEGYFDVDGPAGRWMMCNTASLQINVSHDVDDPEARWRLMHLIGPVLVAAFANSPGRDTAGRPWASLRQGIWSMIDRGRTDPPRADSPAAEAWSDYVLAADVMLVRSAGDAVCCPPGTPFSRWMADGLAGRRPSTDDLRYHVTTLFPPVRPRGWLELRVLDALPAATREVAALVVAACLQPAASRDLFRALPDTSDGWAAAARHGLEDDTLAAAADVVFATAVEHVPAVTDRAERRRAVTDYVDDYVARRLQPWGGRVSQHQQRTLVDLDSRGARSAPA